jgi:hypothetical protein
MQKKKAKERDPAITIHINFEPFEAYKTLKYDFLKIVGFENLFISRKKSNYYLKKAGIAIQVKDLDTFEIEEDKSEFVVALENHFEKFKSNIFKEMKNLESSPLLKEITQKCFEACQTFFDAKMDQISEKDFSKKLAELKKTLDSIKIVKQNSSTLFKPQSTLLKNIAKIKNHVDALMKEFNIEKSRRYA